MDNYEQSLNQAEYEHAMREQEQAYKSWIKKIIELLNEFEIWKDKQKPATEWRYHKIRERSQWLFVWVIIWSALSERASKFCIIGKDYGFIKRLVNENKINFEKTWYTKIEWVETRNGDLTTFTQYESLLMLLSIQNDPYWFLIHILK